MIRLKYFTDFAGSGTVTLRSEVRKGERGLGRSATWLMERYSCRSIENMPKGKL